MGILLWIVIFVSVSLFWVWIIFAGGAEFLEGSVFSLLVGWWAINWSADGIRLFAWVSWILSGLWFLLGVFVPEARIAAMLQ